MKKERSDNTKSSLSNYLIQGNVLGSGEFGTVRTAVQTSTGKTVAIKTYNKLIIVDKDRLKAISKEFELLGMISNEFVIKCIEKVENKRNIHLVMEYGGRHTLLEFLKLHPTKDEPSNLYFIRPQNAVYQLNARSAGHP